MMLVTAAAEHNQAPKRIDIGGFRSVPHPIGHVQKLSTCN